ncbi:MAG: hypothetical protein MRJ68_13170 [Nitrospira sp.]|nr:hypothetical protein [Nitrospira sp.]
MEGLRAMAMVAMHEANQQVMNEFSHRPAAATRRGGDETDLAHWRRELAAERQQECRLAMPSSMPS